MKSMMMSGDFNGLSKLVSYSKCWSLSDDAEAPEEFVLAAFGVPQRAERLHGGVEQREEPRMDGGETTPPVSTAALTELAIHLNEQQTSGAANQKS